MIEVIRDLPDNTIGIAAKGRVTEQDYESVIEPMVEEIFKRHDKARFLYHLGEDFEGFETAAVWEDTKLGFSHYRGWEKVALVTDRNWLRGAFRAFGVFMPGQVKTFGSGELEQAKQWVAS